ncbi:MAG: recombinase family protein [Novosphingobium sp.]
MRNAETKRPRVLRCAIYTRKSTEDGLEQEFNSLDAQREACAAYILSQRHEGWALVPEHYDDGGFSGGTMDRPGLKQLLAEVEAGKVDVIVVYKVDRLTRALSDFAKIVDVLDANGASFVSVTQAFNTTTSMGRLTLNVLLSFAQFEREVTGERIRDKIAASKKKGIWMGGTVPLGYDVRERRLAVNQPEAEMVRHIFGRYLELGSVRDLVTLLGMEGWRTKVQIRASGPHRGGVAFGRGGVLHLLKNRIYLGEIVHKGVSYPGEHESIVPRALWDAVQAKLATRDHAGDRAMRSRSPSLLVGLLHDGLGRRMSPSHANKQGRRYRYYITHDQQRADRSQPTWRVPAHELEQMVINNLRGFLCDGAAMHNAIDIHDGAEIEALLGWARTAAASLGEGIAASQRAVLQDIIERIDLHDDHVDMMLRLSPLASGVEANHHLSFPVQRLRRGQVVKLILPGSEPDITNRDSRLVGLVAEAYAARQAVFEQTGSLAQIATRLGKCRGHLADMMRISYLAPDIVAAIVEGRQPVSLKRKTLMATSLSLDWSEQRRQLGFA